MTTATPGLVVALAALVVALYALRARRSTEDRLAAVERMHRREQDAHATTQRQLVLHRDAHRHTTDRLALALKELDLAERELAPHRLRAQRAKE